MPERVTVRRWVFAGDESRIEDSHHTTFQPRLPEQRGSTPDREKQADDHEKPHPSGAIDGVRHVFGGLTASVLPPGQPVADEKRETEGQDQLWHQILEVEEVTHRWHRNPE